MEEWQFGEESNLVGLEKISRKYETAFGFH
jgi:hypothetical protein